MRPQLEMSSDAREVSCCKAAARMITPHLPDDDDEDDDDDGDGGYGNENYCYYSDFK